ncbi:hypothetical protein Gasu2_04680 [Galdieria sulphuraria]|nr:hypothetical protein Gasu2_04680 [Galdieria sulphuraria]
MRRNNISKFFTAILSKYVSIGMLICVYNPTSSCRLFSRYIARAMMESDQRIFERVIALTQTFYSVSIFEAPFSK